LAANLAHAGMRVLLLEAGGDSENYNYQVPCFHGQATEDPEYSWSFFVRHYGDDRRQQQDSKFEPARDGVFYPRAGTLGGCTAHNAMITVYPHNEDWDRIADLTGDKSWRSGRMRAYFERLERCDYRDRPWGYPRQRWLAGLVRRIPLLSGLFRNRGRHGYDGWLTTKTPDPTIALPDAQLRNVIFSAARAELKRALKRTLGKIEDLILGDPNAVVDPNDWRYQATSGEGLWFIPLATRNGRRNGTREYIRETQARLPEHLVVRTECLVTRVLFEGTRAIGVEYLEAPHAYRADSRGDDAATDGQRGHQAFARREVVLSGGAFNTPQLLKLSGVGPATELAKFGIVVTKMKKAFGLLEGATFAPPVEDGPRDRFFEQWLQGTGLYCTNGAVLGIIKKSRPDRPTADLFIFGLPALFRGYYSRYSKDLTLYRDCFTWAVLKAHTENTGGRVSLRSADPRDMPEVNFHYFEEGTDSAGEDLEAVVEGVLFARDLMKHAEPHVETELLPGPDVQTREQIAEFIRKEAWGHHASCTCRMGPPSDPLAVVDSAFRVHGSQGLRIVDASVFPRIPGFFIVTAIYMASEKATDAILADVPRSQRVRRRVGKAVRQLRHPSAAQR
jgi:choline dehydrogenase-like flavoprotein